MILYSKTKLIRPKYSEDNDKNNENKIKIETHETSFKELVQS